MKSILKTHNHKANIFTLSITLITMVLSAAHMNAQIQVGSLVENTTSESPFADPDLPYGNRLNVWAFEILDDPNVSIGCDSSFKYSINYIPEVNENPSTTDKSFWPTLPGGPGMKQFTARITYKVMAFPNQYRFMQDNNFYVYINGEECMDCTTEAVWEAGGIDCDNAVTMLVTVHYPATDVYETDGIWDFTLSPQLSTAAYDCNTSWDWGCFCDAYNGQTGYELHFDELPSIKFTAVMAGSSFTEQLGNFSTPENVTCILRDPPGDGSYSRWESGDTQCFGSSFYSSTETEVSTWTSVKYGFGVPLVFDAEIEGTISASTAESNSETYEVQTCVEVTNAYETNDEGIPADDLFIGSSINYAYGMATTIYREGCEIVKVQGLAMAPLSQLTEFAHRESHIRGSIIPQLEAIIEILTPGSIEWDAKTAQLDVWNQTLDMNDAIKAEAALYELNPIESWSSGTIKENTVSLTSSETKAIDMKVKLSNSLDIGYTADLGWAEIESNLQISLRTEYGSTETNTTETENTLFYHMEDDDDDQNGGNDVFNVNIMTDKVFGTSVFVLDQETSETSCPYEGGIAIEQPQLWVEEEDQNSMILSDVPVGTAAVFSVLVCNDNAERDITYNLSVPAQGNDAGAQVQYNGQDLNNFVVPITISAGDCETININLTQDLPTNLSFENVQLQLSSGCDVFGDNGSDNNIEPSIIELSAYFGTGIGIGENEIPSEWFSVQPNPSNGLFQIIPSGTGTPIEVTVYDLTGRAVITPLKVNALGIVEIDLGSSASGLYVLTANRDGARRSMKLLVN